MLMALMLVLPHLPRSGTSWSEQQKIVSTDIAGNDHFGWAASISGDGNTVIVGARQESAEAAKLVPPISSQDQEQQHGQQQKILAANAGASDQFGHSVSIDNDADSDNWRILMRTPQHQMLVLLISLPALVQVGPNRRYYNLRI